MTRHNGLSIVTIGAALSMTAGLAFAGDTVSADQILGALKPKPLTRGLSVAPVDTAAQAKEAGFNTVRVFGHGEETSFMWQKSPGVYDESIGECGGVPRRAVWWRSGTGTPLRLPPAWRLLWAGRRVPRPSRSSWPAHMEGLAGGRPCCPPPPGHPSPIPDHTFDPNPKP